MYLGYALAEYSEFYKIDHVMLLGRVCMGPSCNIVMDAAKKVLDVEFPEFSHIKFHSADDKFKAVAQCLAAASLPTIKANQGN